MINKRLIQEMNTSMKYVKKNIIFQWISLLASIIMVFAIGKFLNEWVTGMLSIKSMLFLAFVGGICIIIRSFCMVKSSTMSYYASKDVKRCLRERIYRKALDLGSSYVSNVSTSEIVQMSSEGIEQLENYFGSYLPQFFYSLLAPITLFIFLAPLDLLVASILLICVPLIPISIILVQKFAKKLLNKYWGQYTTLGDSFLENLQGLTTLKIYQADKMRHEKMNQEAENFRKVTMKVLIMQLNSISVMDLIAYGASALGIVVAIHQMVLGRLTLAEGFIIIILSAEFFLPLRLLGSYFHIAMNGMASSEKIFKFLDLSSSLDGDYEIQKGDCVELNDVFFKYDEKQVLQNINLKIEKGKLIALLGESGSGKSTITALLQRRIKPDKGTIKVDSLHSTNIKKESLMKHITLVNLTSYVFKGTVKENLLIAKQDATDRELWDILEKVDLKNHFEKQDGLQTQLHEKGSNLSGGQNQRLVLARALLHNSEIYIFDEATSNIDSESENKVLDLIYQLAKEKAVLLITHRLKNAMNASEIIILEEGRIIGRGKHEELLVHNNKYKCYWKTQSELENLGMVNE